MPQAPSDGGRPSRSRLRPLRWLGLVVVVGLLILGWAAYQSWQGARSLDAAADQLRSLQAELTASGGTDGLREASEQTAQARAHLEDPVVRALATLPWVGEPLASATAVARAADVTVGDALLPLATAAGDDPADRLTRGPGSVDVDYLASLAAPAAQASEQLQEAADLLAQASSDTGVARVDSAVQQLDEELQQLRSTVADVALALEIAPELLGQDGTRRYLVVSQSPAEPRGTGGLIGGYSVLEANDGALRIVRSGPRAELQSAQEPVVELTREFERHYGPNAARRTWINSNLSPHFPYAAQIWMGLWQRQYGEQLDGALVLDPITLSYLLEATGPVPLPDGSQVTADNVVDLTMRDVYARFGGTRAGDVYLQQISNAVAAALTTRELGGRALVEALAQAVQERRLLLWSADDQVQQALADEPISGRLPEGQRAIGDVIIDAAGAKLGYYLERELRYAEGCDGEPSRLALTLTNEAPASGLPDYVTPEPFRRGQPPGTYIVLATLYLPPGSLLRDLTLEGEEVFFRQGTELGLVWVEVLVTLRPGESRELRATFEEAPALADEELERIEQPLVREESFTATTC